MEFITRSGRRINRLYLYAEEKQARKEKMKKEKEEREKDMLAGMLHKIDAALMPKKIGVDAHRNYKRILGRGEE